MDKLKQKGISGMLFDIITDFLNFRKQSCLNDQYSSWTSIKARVSDDLTINVKLFAVDTSLFSIVHNMNTSAINLNNDLNKTKNWTIQWKMNFSPILEHKLRRLYFQESFKKQIIIKFISIRTPFKQVLSKKHIRMYVDIKLIFQEHLNNVLSKVNKTIVL